MSRTDPASAYQRPAPEADENPTRSFLQRRPDGPGLAVHVLRTGTDTTRLAVAGPLDRSAVPVLAAVLDRHRHVHGQRNTRLDLSGLTRIDTAGLSALIRAHHQFRSNDRHLTLSATQPSYARLVTLTGLDQILVLDTSSTRRHQHPRRPPSRRALEPAADTTSDLP